jgi:hypothetical protein
MECGTVPKKAEMGLAAIWKVSNMRLNAGIHARQVPSTNQLMKLQNARSISIACMVYGVWCTVPAECEELHRDLERVHEGEYLHETVPMHVLEVGLQHTLRPSETEAGGVEHGEVKQLQHVKGLGVVEVDPLEE